jgi:hypothetical protein
MLSAGTAIGCPLIARAQQKAMPVIGWLSALSPQTQVRGPGSVIAAFLEGLNQTGYVEGQNVAIEYRWAEGHPDRLPALAARSRRPEGRCGRGGRRRQPRARGLGRTSGVGRFDPFTCRHSNGRKRRILPVAARSSESRLTSATAVAQAWRPEPVFIPHSGHWPRPA